MSEPLDPRPRPDTDGAAAGAGIGGENPNGGAQAMMMTNGAIAGLGLLAYILCKQGMELLFAISILLIVALAVINLVILKKVQAAIRRMTASAPSLGTGKQQVYSRR